MGEWTPDADTASVFATMSVNGVVGGVFLLLYLYFSPRNPDVYSPRSIDLENKERDNAKRFNCQPQWYSFISDELFCTGLGITVLFLLTVHLLL